MDGPERRWRPATEPATRRAFLCARQLNQRECVSRSRRRRIVPVRRRSTEMHEAVRTTPPSRRRAHGARKQHALSHARRPQSTSWRKEATIHSFSMAGEATG